MQIENSHLTHTAKKTDLQKLPDTTRYVTKSPGMLVMFGDGKVLHMNRKTRRKYHLYGDRIKRGENNGN